MNEPAIAKKTEFVFRRLGEAFPLSTPETPALAFWLVCGALLLFAGLSFLVPILRVVRHRLAAAGLRGLIGIAFAYLAATIWIAFKPKDAPLFDMGSFFCWACLVGGALSLLLFGLSGAMVLTAQRDPEKPNKDTEGMLFGVLATVGFGRVDTGHLTWWHFATAGTRALLFLIPLSFMLVARHFESDTDPLWYGCTALMLIAAFTLTLLMYIRDSGSVSRLVLILPFTVLLLLAAFRAVRWSDLGKWAKVLPLVFLRNATLALLAYCFLLPSLQTWETTEKHSRVLILIDISPSVVKHSDEISRNEAIPTQTRMDKVLDFLSNDKEFLPGLLKNNPVHIYRFGTRLDDEAAVLNQSKDATAAPPWGRDDWKKFIQYDFKAWLLAAKAADGKGLSEDAQAKLRQATAWGNEPGSADWGIGYLSALKDTARAADTGVEALAPVDQEILKSLRVKLDKRIEVSRSIDLGTAVPESILGAINRESANMTQAVIVFTDGRSNTGSESTLGELNRRAKETNIPVFTVVVGESREIVKLNITDFQVPSRTQPDEPTQIAVAVDGVGFKEGEEVPVILELYLPGRDPKAGDQPDHEITQPVKFVGGETPHGETTFVLDAEELAKKGVMALVEEIVPPKPNRKYQLKQGKDKGAWRLRAKVATDPRELFKDPFHYSVTKTMEVIDKPIRILMIASAPSREYQTLRSLLVREMDQKRAELCIFLQNEGGQKGTIVQDVPPSHLLQKFPDALDTEKETVAGADAADPIARERMKFNNLNEYDLIIAFDPNWNEKDDAGQYKIPNDAFLKLRTWVQTLGGGLVYIAGPFHTTQLVRSDEQGGRLKPFLDLLPVKPDDLIATEDVLVKISNKKTARRLKVNPPNDSDLLRLDEETGVVEEKDKAVAGWERFFTGGNATPAKTTADYLTPKRGMFTYYPVRETKPGVKPLLEFVNVDDKGQEALRPFYAVTQTGAGRCAWIGSAEIYRIRATPENGTNYYDKFWLKLARYASAKRNAGAKSRGYVLVNEKVTVGTPIRIQTRLLQTNGEAYPEGEVDKPKFTIKQFDQNDNFIKEYGPFDVLKPTKIGKTFEGYYKGAITPDPRQFPVDNTRYRVYVTKADLPVPLEAEFVLQSSNPELDNTKPDKEAMLKAASGADETLKRAVPELAKRQELMARLSIPADELPKAKLAFELREKEKLHAIPELIKEEIRRPENPGPVDDLWDDEVTPSEGRWESLTGWARIALIKPPAGGSGFTLRLWLPVSILLGLLLAVAWIARTRVTNNGLALALTVGMLLLSLLIGLTIWFGNPFPIGWVVLLGATLLCLEWTVRKIYRLA